MTGHINVKPMLGMAKCKPGFRQDICALCRRHTSSAPDDPLHRPNEVLIDASIAAELESCPMFQAEREEVVA